MISQATWIDGRDVPLDAAARSPRTLYRFAGLRRAILLSIVTAGLLALALVGARSAEADYTPTGPLVADSGFRPSPNGYSFPNYGNDPGTVNMSAAEMVKLFGREVCENAVGRCQLTSVAREFMQAINKAMEGGHCMGLAITAELFHAGLGRPRTPSLLANGATNVFSLPMSTRVQRHIAYAWAFQALPSMQAASRGLDARQLIARLRSALVSRREAFTLAIFKRDGDGGHAITPFAIESRSGGRFRVLVYDNNYPGRTRTMRVNVNTNVWQYEASINPNVRGDLYDGKGKDSNLRLYPSTPGLGRQDCFFCGNTEARPKLRLVWSGDPDTREHGNLVIRDRRGRRTGCGNFRSGFRCVNRIPGAVIENLILGGENVWEQSAQPNYRLPADRGYTISLTGGRLRKPARESFILFGKDRFAGVAGVRLGPRERDSLSVSRGLRKVVFRNDRRQLETPRLRIGVDTKRASYLFELKARRVSRGARVVFRLNAKRRRLLIRGRDLRRIGRYTLKLVKTNAKGRTVKRLRVRVVSGQLVVIRYGT